MKPFEFFSVPRIIVQRGGRRRLGELTAAMGTRALLVHNAPPLVDEVVGILRASGLAYQVFTQHGEPTVQDVGAALAMARAAGSDVVIGLGGGSAIDLAKAVAALLTNSGEVLDYLEVVVKGQKITKRSAPWIAVPTTAGTGAEATWNAVIGYKEKHFKASIRSELMLARIALLDAQMQVTVPPAVTAASGCDALCQVIESYTSTGANPISDGLALEGIARAGRSLARAYHNGTDLDAREDMAIAALLSGITLANAGLGAVHGFAAPMGANFPVPHGVVCAALLPHVIDANVRVLRAENAEHPTLRRYATIGRVLRTGASSTVGNGAMMTSYSSPVGEVGRGLASLIQTVVDVPALSGRVDAGDPAAIDAAVAFVADLTRELAIPPLRNYGVTESSITPMVELAKKASSMRYNPVTLNDEALGDVLRRAI